MTRLLLFAMLCADVCALELPPQFSDNMVLQRKTDNVIWGLRTPGKVVRVEYRANGDEKPVLLSDTSTKKPGWQVEISAGDGLGKNKGPGTITIWEGERRDTTAPRIVLKNILVGDVWVVAIPPGQGFSRKPKAYGDVRVLSTPTAGALDTLGPAGRFSWKPLEQLDALPLLAEELAGAMRTADPGTPIGLVVTSTEQWPGSLQLVRSDRLTQSSANFLPAALRKTTDEYRKQRGIEESTSIRFKYAGQVTNMVNIRPYTDLEPFARKEYPAALKAVEWNYLGALSPVSGR